MGYDQAFKFRVYGAEGKPINTHLTAEKIQSNCARFGQNPQLYETSFTNNYKVMVCNDHLYVFNRTRDLSGRSIHSVGARPYRFFHVGNTLYLDSSGLSNFSLLVFNIDQVGY